MSRRSKKTDAEDMHGNEPHSVNHSSLRRSTRKLVTETRRRSKKTSAEDMHRSESYSANEGNNGDCKTKKEIVETSQKRNRNRVKDAISKVKENEGTRNKSEVTFNRGNKPNPKRRRVIKERLPGHSDNSSDVKANDGHGALVGQSANSPTKVDCVDLRGTCSKMHYPKSVVVDSVSSSGSEDEWEEMEEVEPLEQHHVLEVTIQQPKHEDTEESKWAKFIRQEVNRQINKRQINCHKMHLLCYVAHLRQWMRCLVRSEYLSAQCLSLIPLGYVSTAELTFDAALAERFLKWFRSAFTPAKVVYEAKGGPRDAQAERLGRLISDRVYETDKDIASILLLCIFALKQSVRLCLSCQPLRHRVNACHLIRSITLNKTCENEKAVADVGDKRSVDERNAMTKEVKRWKKSNWSKNSEHSDGGESLEGVKRRQRYRTKRKMEVDSSREEMPTPQKVKLTPKTKPERNYWVEYWDEISEKWICMDPLRGTVDVPGSLEADATPPMHYVIAVDNDFGVRDVTARYASKYLSAEVRRLRIDEEWWSSSLQPFRSKDRARERIESVSIHDSLLSKPMPVTIAEFKNHPLYVLKKDLLKFEAIYPEDQKPIAVLRGGIEVYPRSSVHHLQGSLNWIKQARSIKPGEKPYKVVKARPNIRIPEEQREPRTLDVYGYWQTEPYVPPHVVDGRIPRNEYGNIYMYKPCMLPKGCVHLRLDGLYGIARQMDVECVPAVVGWDFHKGGNHPIIDGCVVLSKDAMKLKAAWEEHYEKKRITAMKRRRMRAVKNWKRLFRGVLMMKKVRAEFLGPDHRHITVDEQLEGGEMAEEVQTLTQIGDDMALAWPHARFDLPTLGSHRENE